MASAPLQQIDPRDYRIGRLFAQRIWRLVGPYWIRRGATGAWIAFITSVGLAGLSSLLLAGKTIVVKDLTDALIARRADAFWYSLALFLIVIVGTALVGMSAQIIGAWLNQNWRRWLTDDLVKKYLAKRTYYDITLTGGLDNPDQRIQESVAPFVSAATEFPGSLLGQVTAMVTGAVILATIDSRMVPFVIAFAIVQAAAAYAVQIPTIKKNYQITVAEADLRYGVLHVRDHAEAIAFYGGEDVEYSQIMHRLRHAIKRQMSLLLFKATVVYGSGAIFSTTWEILPYFVLGPLYMSSKLTYGEIAQAMVASSSIIVSLATMVQILPNLAVAAPHAVRLAQIMERFESLGQTSANENAPQVAIERGGQDIRISHLNLSTPAKEQMLIRNLTLTVSPAENLVIVGQTGVGKSSLLRAMAGLWTAGSGNIAMPPSAACMFLPQRPYMILADLRSQLLYPGDADDVSDSDLQAVLEAVNLPNLASQYGGLSTVRDWEKVLSLGEQQRIGFARMMIKKPAFVFLDEATSAVDFVTEAMLYERLRESGATFVSVGHRLSILDYHAQMLTILTGGKWKLEKLSGQTAEATAMFTEG